MCRIVIVFIIPTVFINFPVLKKMCFFSLFFRLWTFPSMSFGDEKKESCLSTFFSLFSVPKN